MKNMKIAFRLAFLAGSLVLLLLIVGGLGLRGLWSVGAGLQTVYEDRTVALAQVADVQNSLQGIRIGVMTAAISGDSTVVAQQRSLIADYQARLDRAWGDYMLTFMPPDERAMAEELATALAQYEQTRTRVLDLAADGAFEESAGLMRSDGQRTFQAAAALTAALIDYQVRLAEEIYQDAQRTIATNQTLFFAIGGGGLALAVLLSLVIARSITVPLAQSVSVMGRLAANDTAVTVEGQERRDEIGQIARAVEVFKTNAIERERLREQEAQEQAAKERRTQRMADLTAQFDAQASDTLKGVSAAATEMNATAQSLVTVAERNDQQAATVAAASEQATNNVQTVASATEELAASIAEIGRQVEQSTRISRNAVAEAERTSQVVAGLAEAAERIGSVVALIQQIAEQTNLLALNATIEAARAGDAGKGFAVVASEVKNLASQTAKATEEIAQQVTGIQDETKTAVQAIGSITGVIGEVSQIAAAIAAAIEQQNAATGEISSNVAQAAAGTQEVSNNIGTVAQGSAQTKQSATEVQTASDELARNADQLKTMIETFLRDIRAA